MLPLRTTTLHTIDRAFFGPVCRLLTWVRRLTERTDDARESPRFGSVVFVKLTEQGSTVLAAASLRRMIAKVGAENVFFAVFEENRFVLDAMALIPPENVFTVSTRSVWTMLCDALRVLVRLRRRRIDAAVDLEFFTRFSAAFTYLSGANWRAGLHGYFGEGPSRGDLMTHRVLYNPHLHTSEMFLVLVEALNRRAADLPTFDFRPGVPEDVLPIFQPTAEEVAEVTALLHEQTGGLPAQGGGRPRLVLLNANASDLIPLRRWPGERYVALARRLLEATSDLQVAFTGSADEAEAGAQLAAEIGCARCFSLAGRTSLRELLTLYGLSEVLVTNDSGPAHFAALTAVHTVTLFGPETPALFAAHTPRSVPLWAGIACSPCVSAWNNRQSACRNNLCMQEITVEQVFETVQRLLAQRLDEASAPPGDAD